MMKTARASMRGPPIPAPTIATVLFEKVASVEMGPEMTVAVGSATPILDFWAGESSRVPTGRGKVFLVQSLPQDQVLFPHGIIALVVL